MGQFRQLSIGAPMGPFPIPFGAFQSFVVMLGFRDAFVSCEGRGCQLSATQLDPPSTPTSQLQRNSGEAPEQ